MKRRINNLIDRFCDWFNKLWDDIEYRLTTVEVCPREYTKDGKPTGWDCKYTSHCIATHYRVPRA